MTGLKFEYTWLTAVFLFTVFERNLYGYVHFTFLVIGYEVNYSDAIHMEWEELHNIEWNNL